MGRNRFIEDGDIVRLDLTDGDWVDVRRELDYGRQQRMATAGMRSVSQPRDGEQPEIAIDWDRFSVARIEAWVTGWSFCDKTGRPRQFTRANIERLHPATAQEILDALDRHQAELDEAQASPNGGTPPIVTSPSAGGWDGVGPTSEQPRPLSSVG